MELLFRTSKIIIWYVWFKKFLSMTFFLLLVTIKLCQKCWKSFCKNFNTVKFKFKCNLLSLRCFLESIISLCAMNGIFLSAHINTEPLLTLAALLLRLSKRGTMPDTITELSVFFNDVVQSMINFAIWLAVFSVRRSFLPACKIMWSGLSSRRVGFTWSTIQLTFASESYCTLKRYLCLTFFGRK